MEHPRPDDREHFERHPDVRGLAGLDRHQHPHIDEGLSIVRAEIIPPDTSRQAD
jgi:hypothetical protein